MSKVPSPGPAGVAGLVRTIACPLCSAPPLRPCGPDGSHLARWLRAFAVCRITRTQLTAAVAGRVVVDACQVIGEAS